MECHWEWKQERMLKITIKNFFSGVHRFSKLTMMHFQTPLLLCVAKHHQKCFLIFCIGERKIHSWPDSLLNMGLFTVVHWKKKNHHMKLFSCGMSVHQAVWSLIPFKNVCEHLKCLVVFFFNENFERFGPHNNFSKKSVFAASTYGPSNENITTYWSLQKVSLGRILISLSD